MIPIITGPERALSANQGGNQRGVYRGEWGGGSGHGWCGVMGCWVIGGWCKSYIISPFGAFPLISGGGMWGGLLQVIGYHVLGVEGGGWLSGFVGWLLRVVYRGQFVDYWSGAWIDRGWIRAIWDGQCRQLAVYRYPFIDGVICFRYFFIMLGQVRSSLDQVMLGQVRSLLGQVRLGQNKLGQVRS